MVGKGVFYLGLGFCDSYSLAAGAGLQPVSNYGVEFVTQLARQGQAKVVVVDLVL
jgi:hypothetical protein